MSSKRQKRRKQKNRPGSGRGAKAYVPFDVDRGLEKALQYHQTGELKKAEKICKKILKIAPNDSRLLHLRGFVAYQLGKNNLAIEFITKATLIRPDHPTYWYNLALPFIAEGRLSEALSCYQKALQLVRDLPFDELVSHRFAIEDAAAGFELMQKPEDVCKVLINI